MLFQRRIKIRDGIGGSHKQALLRRARAETHIDSSIDHEPGRADGDVGIGIFQVGEEASLWQVYAFQQVGETRVGAQRVIKGSVF